MSVLIISRRVLFLRVVILGAQHTTSFGLVEYFKHIISRAKTLWQGLLRKFNQGIVLEFVIFVRMPLYNNLNYLHHLELFGIIIKCHEAKMKLTKYRKYLKKFQSLAKVGFLILLIFDDQISYFGCLDEIWFLGLNFGQKVKVRLFSV